MVSATQYSHFPAPAISCCVLAESNRSIAVNGADSLHLEGYNSSWISLRDLETRRSTLSYLFDPPKRVR